MCGKVPRAKVLLHIPPSDRRCGRGLPPWSGSLQQSEVLDISATNVMEIYGKFRIEVEAQVSESMDEDRPRFLYSLNHDKENGILFHFSNNKVIDFLMFSLSVLDSLTLWADFRFPFPSPVDLGLHLDVPDGGGLVCVPCNWNFSGSTTKSKQKHRQSLKQGRHIIWRQLETNINDKNQREISVKNLNEKNHTEK